MGNVIYPRPMQMRAYRRALFQATGATLLLGAAVVGGLASLRPTLCFAVLVLMILWSQRAIRPLRAAAFIGHNDGIAIGRTMALGLLLALIGLQP